MRHRDLVCPYEHPGGPAAVIIIRPSDHSVPRRLGGVGLSPVVVPGADVHCTVCHYESWIPVDKDWRPGNLREPRACSCGEIYGPTRG